MTKILGGLTTVRTVDCGFWSRFWLVVFSNTDTETVIPSADYEKHGKPLASRKNYQNKANPCILGGWPFRVELTSVGAAIAPHGSF